ncbi:MAG: uncharacterized protein A8A55_2774 [Amphiamblys sp. WSBS2006]|nr:MAG: uncharacterized protein A8A55_2774 [Amphiamblys sp. WSBS2006]
MQGGECWKIKAWRLVSTSRIYNEAGRRFYGWDTRQPRGVTSEELLRISPSCKEESAETPRCTEKLQEGLDDRRKPFAVKQVSVLAMQAVVGTVDLGEAQAEMVGESRVKPPRRRHGNLSC